MQAERVNPAEGSNPGSPPTPYWTISTRQREPPIFAGLRGDDVEDWLDTFNRVSAFNRWDDSLKLSNVGWSLREVAETWFYNNEEKFTSWSAFTAELRKIFGTPATRSEAAKKKLDVRVQHPGETYTSYIEDVLALCRRVNASMTEDERVRHIVKGISNFAFHALALQNPTSVDDIKSTCQRLDTLQSQRLPSATWDSPAPTDSDLRSIIRSIIREELQGQPEGTLSGGLNQSCIPGLRGMIKEELASITCAPPPKADIPVTSSTAKVPLLHPFPHACAPVSYSEPPQPAQALMAPLSTTNAPNPYYSPWRPTRPTCFYCGIRGHISRFCRRRQQDERQAYATYRRRDTSPPYEYRQQPFDHRQQPSASFRRSSPSPDTRDFPSNPRQPRRRSPSPFRRTSSPLRPATQAFDRHPEN